MRSSRITHQSAARFYDQIAYDDDFNALALESSEGERESEQPHERPRPAIDSHLGTPVSNESP